MRGVKIQFRNLEELDRVTPMELAGVNLCISKQYREAQDAFEKVVLYDPSAQTVHRIVREIRASGCCDQKFAQSFLTLRRAFDSGEMPAVRFLLRQAMEKHPVLVSVLMGLRFPPPYARDAASVAAPTPGRLPTSVLHDLVLLRLNIYATAPLPACDRRLLMDVEVSSSFGR